MYIHEYARESHVYAQVQGVREYEYSMNTYEYVKESKTDAQDVWGSCLHVVWSACCVVCMCMLCGLHVPHRTGVGVMFMFVNHVHAEGVRESDVLQDCMEKSIACAAYVRDSNVMYRRKMCESSGDAKYVRKGDTYSKYAGQGEYVYLNIYISIYICIYIYIYIYI